MKSDYFFKKHIITTYRVTDLKIIEKAKEKLEIWKNIQRTKNSMMYWLE